MAQITIDIPDELEFMKDIPKEKWSEIAVSMIKSKLDEAEKIMKIAKKSQATEKDVDELTDKANKGMIKHYSRYYEK